MHSQPGLFSQFCEVGELGDHPHEDFAKFGYRSARKIYIFWKHAIFLQHEDLLSKSPDFKRKKH
jgi:hypothetical protein